MVSGFYSLGFWFNVQLWSSGSSLGTLALLWNLGIGLLVSLGSSGLWHLGPLWSVSTSVSWLPHWLVGPWSGTFSGGSLGLFSPLSNDRRAKRPKTLQDWLFTRGLSLDICGLFCHWSQDTSRPTNMSPLSVFPGSLISLSLFK